MSPFPFIKVWVSMESTDISIYSFNLFLLHYDKAVQVLSETLWVKTCLYSHNGNVDIPTSTEEMYTHVYLRIIKVIKGK